jgi:hypothetical protein
MMTLSSSGFIKVAVPNAETDFFYPLAVLVNVDVSCPM